MFLFLLIGAGVIAAIAVTQRGTPDETAMPARWFSEAPYMIAQLRNAGAQWGVFERSKKVFVVAPGFEPWDLVQTPDGPATATKDTAQATFKRVMADAARESPDKELTARLLGIDDAGNIVADTVLTTPPATTRRPVDSAPYGPPTVSGRRGVYQRGHYRR